MTDSPNVVIVLLDDVGFSAGSTFGGSIAMPNLDNLAARGLKYNRFHVTGLCSSTRASLLSGRDPHRIGFGNVVEFATDVPGYNSIWNGDAVGIAEILRRHGYGTAAFGKWHNTPVEETTPVGPFDRWPIGKGFEYFYGFMGSDVDQWSPSLFRNTEPVEPPVKPDRIYHLTEDLVDDAIAWVRMRESVAPNTPYFAFFAPGATHGPHQVPESWIKKYDGRFDQGWDVLREEIAARQKSLGIVPASTKLTPRPKNFPAWKSFSSAEQKWLARQMEVYAAFLSHTDHEIGRLIEAVQSGPHGDNTLIMYIVGDNGADLYGEIALSSKDGNLTNASIDERLRHIGHLGGKEMFGNYHQAWAWAMNTPFQWGKLIASHFGNTRSPLVVSWPKRINSAGEVRTQFAHVTDIAATIYEVAGVSFPSTVDGVKQLPLDGTSFASSFADATAPSRHRVQVFEQHGNRAIYKDGWVAAALHWVPSWRTPFKCTGFENDRWELYNIETDFSQANDLSGKYPERVRQLKRLFDSEARKRNVFPLGSGVESCVPRNRLSARSYRKQFVYYPDTPRLPACQRCSELVPDFSRSHRITAQVTIPATGAEGVLASSGSRYGGFSLYVKNDHLIYESRSAWNGEANVIVSETALPVGKITLGYEVACADGKSSSDGSPTLTQPCLGRLLINGERVGESPQSRVRLGGTFGVGRAFESSVTSEFAPPFAFTGALAKVEVAVE